MKSVLKLGLVAVVGIAVSTSMVPETQAGPFGLFGKKCCEKEEAPAPEPCCPAPEPECCPAPEPPPEPVCCPAPEPPPEPECPAPEPVCCEAPPEPPPAECCDCCATSYALPPPTLAEGEVLVWVEPVLAPNAFEANPTHVEIASVIPTVEVLAYSSPAATPSPTQFVSK